MDEWYMPSEEKLSTYRALRAMFDPHMCRTAMTPEETLSFYRGFRAI